MRVEMKLKSKCQGDSDPRTELERSNTGTLKWSLGVTCFHWVRRRESGGTMTEKGSDVGVFNGRKTEEPWIVTDKW